MAMSEPRAFMSSVPLRDIIVCPECKKGHPFHPQMIEKRCKCGARVRRPK